MSGQQFNVRLPDDLMARLNELSRETGVPKTRIARVGLEMVLEQGFPRGNPRQAAREALGIETPEGTVGPQTDGMVGIASESRPEMTKDSRTEADAPTPPSIDLAAALHFCPSPDCKFGARSKAAICPIHGRRVQ